MDVKKNTCGMVTSTIQHNAPVLDAELAWLSKLFQIRIRSILDSEYSIYEVIDVNPPYLKDSETHYGQLVANYNLTWQERLILALALASRIIPNFVQSQFTTPEAAKVMTKFGLKYGSSHESLIPTRETALYLIAGENLEDRFDNLRLFQSDHVFYQHNILRSNSESNGESPLWYPLSLSDEITDFVLWGRRSPPIQNSEQFPAHLLTISLAWEELILDPYTTEQIDEIRAWLEFGSVLKSDKRLGRKLTPGFVSIFHGPSGVGKTLTASLLGKVTGKEVYRVHTPGVISRYVGETEKSLDRLMQRASELDCILFFDECESIFSQRVAVSSSLDKFANQEVSFLLQRIESYPGLIILATNMKSNIDKSFTRRFQSFIYFPIPNKSERLKLWQHTISELIPLAQKVDLDEISEKYELTGGSIVNVIRHATLMALRRNEKTINQSALEYSIHRELQKEGGQS